MSFKSLGSIGTCDSCGHTKICRSDSSDNFNGWSRINIQRDNVNFYKIICPKCTDKYFKEDFWWR